MIYGGGIIMNMHNFEQMDNLPIFEFLDDFFEIVILIIIFVFVILFIRLFFKVFNKNNNKNSKSNSFEEDVKEEGKPLENNLPTICRNELKEISKLENQIDNFEIKELVRDIVEISVKIVRLSDDDDENRLKNFYNYYIPQFHKILSSYKIAMDANLDLDYVKNLEKDTIKNFSIFKDSLKKLLEEVLRNDLDNIDIEMKVFEEFLKGKGLGESDFNL